MNNSEPLQGLRDIHLPDPVSFWPPAPGWWLLAALLVVVLVGAVWWWKRWQRNAHRRAALKELQRLRQSLLQGQTTTQIMAELSILLRRAAISRYGRQQVAALSGMAWLEFLDRTGRTTQFRTQGQVLLSAPYRRNTADEVEPLFRLTQDWLQVRA